MIIKKTQLACLIIIALFSCNDSKRTAAGKIIQRIDHYLEQHHRLPVNLTEIGIKVEEEGPIYYQRVCDTTYTIYYGTSLGESKTYNSGKRQWH